jgi:hypothetical protein
MQQHLAYLRRKGCFQGSKMTAPSIDQVRVLSSSFHALAERPMS